MPQTAIIAKARAGSVLRGLAFYGCDQAGQPLQDGVEGTVELSWRLGPQKAFLDHALLCLPDIQVMTLQCMLIQLCCYCSCCCCSQGISTVPFLLFVQTVGT